MQSQEFHGISCMTGRRSVPGKSVARDEALCGQLSQPPPLAIADSSDIEYMQIARLSTLLKTLPHSIHEELRMTCCYQRIRKCMNQRWTKDVSTSIGTHLILQTPR